MSKVTIRHLRKHDEEILSKLADNKKVWDNLRDYIPHPYTRQDAADFIEFILSHKPITTFAVCLDDEFVGVMGYNLQTDIYSHSAEIGYWLGEPYWGNGIASKAILLVIDHAFNTLDLRRLYTAVFDYNPASMKVLEKAGFQREGRGIKSIIKNGEYYDEIKFGLLNPKYFPSEK